MLKLLQATACVVVAWLHFWVYRFAGREGSLPGRGGWIDRRTKPRSFAFGRAISLIMAIGCLVLAVAILISD